MSGVSDFALRARVSVFGVLAAAAVLGVCLPALGAEEAAGDDEELAEVTVTGTRIQVPGNYTASNPITTITGEELRSLGIVNVSDALTQMVPQNISSYMPTMVGDSQAGSGGGGMDVMDRGSYFVGNTIANLRGLDPTFGSRTLTLVDGRRVPSTSNQADVVDLNTIPTSLLERMDVVTGGASATYGSGAVAGVVNLVLNRRMTGVNLDVSYGLNEAGDGSSPSLALSGGLPLFSGKGHLLLSVEYQKTQAIYDCAAARSWCNESRGLFTNSSASQADLAGVNRPLLGYEGLPARFETSNLRYEQRYSEGALYHNDQTITSGYHFDPAGFGGTEYPYGFRGGVSTTAVNGSGAPVTSTTTLLPYSQRKVFFTNFEYDFNESTTGYFQARYGRTEAENRNLQTTGTYCARFDSQGRESDSLGAGAVLYYTQVISGSGTQITKDGEFYPATNDRIRSPQLNAASSLAALAGQLGFGHAAVTGYSNGNFIGPGGVPYSEQQAIAWIAQHGNQTKVPVAGIGVRRGISWPWWLPVDLQGETPPTDDFDGWARDENGRQRARGTWVRVRFTDAAYDRPAGTPGYTGTYYNPYHVNDFWLLESIEMLEPYDGSPLVLPQIGANSYAFLNSLSPEALLQVQRAFGNGNTAGAGNAGVQSLYGNSPCTNFTAIRKLWNPQIQRMTSSETDTWNATAGVRGRFGGDWRWDAYWQYGATDSASRQQNVATNLRLAFALDAVIDDRPGSATYGTPICRIVRDGPPVLDTNGRPVSDPVALADLAAGCQPINLFGTTYSNRATFGDGVDSPYNGIYYDAQALQDAGLAYAFVNSSSSGTVSLQTAAVNASGTLWDGWGAGPLTAAFGAELRENKTDNAGMEGNSYQRADLANLWADAFGGTTRVAEAYTELNLPLVSGVPGVNLFSVNAALRYGIYKNKGGEGTAVDENGNHLSATQKTPNWKVSTTFEPFDWVRLRLTRSRDLRAADYRELFLYQKGIPDEFTIRNPWREGTSTSTENQNERYMQVRVGNPDLKPERSDTLTMGFVLSPGGWAQGLRLSADYFDIKVRDGINTPFNFSNPVTACFEGSNGGASPDDFLDGGDPAPPDMSLAACQELTFSPLYDQNNQPIPGSMNLEDLYSYNSARPVNSLPYQRRGIDFNMGYNFPLSRAFESLPGVVSLNLRATRALESSGVMQTSGGQYTVNEDPCGAAYERADPFNYANNDPSTGEYRTDFLGNPYVVNRYQCIDLVGQIRSDVFVPGVSASPKWTGNLTGSYSLGDFTSALLVRYIGGAKFDKRWVDDPAAPGYYTALGDISNAAVDNNWVKPYVRLDLNLSYNLRVANTKQFRVFGSITNLMDKSPPFTGGGISGATPGYHDTLGRSIRLGVQARF